MKVKKIAAISSAIIFGASTAFTGMPNIVSAQTVSEETIDQKQKNPLVLPLMKKLFRMLLFAAMSSKILIPRKAPKVF